MNALKIKHFLFNQDSEPCHGLFSALADIILKSLIIKIFLFNSNSEITIVIDQISQ